MGRPGKRPRGWTKCPKLRAAYEEGGEAIGRLMVWQPKKAEHVWKLIGGMGLWPKWYLEGFRYHWIKDNPKEYQRYRKNLMFERARKRRTAGRLEESRRQGREAAEQRHQT